MFYSDTASLTNSIKLQYQCYLCDANSTALVTK